MEGRRTRSALVIWFVEVAGPDRPEGLYLARRRLPKALSIWRRERVVVMGHR